MPVRIAVLCRAAEFVQHVEDRGRTGVPRRDVAHVASLRVVRVEYFNTSPLEA